VDQVCDIVKKQLALADGTEVSGSSKFQDLGADSLDTVSEHITPFKFVSTEFISV
jgi:acyl carrier protein